MSNNPLAGIWHNGGGSVTSTPTSGSGAPVSSAPLSSAVATPTTSTPTGSAALLSPPSPPEPEHDHTQSVLAEIHAGNPRPHFRASGPHSPGQGQFANAVSPHYNQPKESARSYFSPPAHSSTFTGASSRVRSLSSAPVLDRSTMDLPPASFGGPTYGEISVPSSTTRSSSQQPDQHGYRPSAGSDAFPSSFPTSSNPIRIGGSAVSSSGNDERSPGGPRMAPVGAASYSGAGPIDLSGWRPNNAPQQHSASSFLGGLGAWDEREGRSRSRTDSRAWGERESSESSADTGIGLSNMSPFARDGGRLLADLPDVPAPYSRTRRDNSLGAVGTGRKRGDSMWGITRPLMEGEEEEEDPVVPTRSGATSRRHSFAEFEFTRPGRSQIGFSLDDDAPGRSTFSSSNGRGGGRSLASKGTFGMGSSTIDDDDLSADLNSLHLNLEAHAAATDSGAHRAFASGSVPSHYPQSRPFDSTATSDGTSFSPLGPVTFHQAPVGTSSSRTFLQPPTTSSNDVAAGRNSSRFEFGGLGNGSSTTSFGTSNGGFPSLGNSDGRAPYYQGQQQQQQDANRYPTFYGLPPSPPVNGPFYSSGAPTPHGLSAQAPAFQTFSPGGTYSSAQQPFFSMPTTLQSVQQLQHQQQQQHQAGPPQDLTNLGRGIPLHAVPVDAPLYIVEFKAGRKDLFFVEDPNLKLRQGDLVIVEADRGKDIGKFFKRCSVEEVQAFQQRLVEMALGQLANPNNPGTASAATIARMTKEFAPKKIFGKAQAADTQLLLSKAQDEHKALTLIRAKVNQKQLAMDVCDAEWQWDRRKLTFYFTLRPGHLRVDFRELVREMFRIYKTRLWLCSLEQTAASWDFN